MFIVVIIKINNKEFYLHIGSNNTSFCYAYSTPTLAFQQYIPLLEQPENINSLPPSKISDKTLFTLLELLCYYISAKEVPDTSFPVSLLLLSFTIGVKNLNINILDLFVI